LLNKNIPDVRKGSQVASIVYSYIQLKGMISGRGQGPGCLQAPNYISEGSAQVRIIG